MRKCLETTKPNNTNNQNQVETHKTTTKNIGNNYET